MRRLRMHAGWRYSRKWRRDVLTAMLACATGWMDAATHRLYFLQLGGGWGATGKGCQIECDDECEHQARLRPLSISFAHLHAG
jgi:hypothetical protein